MAGFYFDGLDEDFAVVRYNSNGSLDTSFDTDGIVITGDLHRAGTRIEVGRGDAYRAVELCRGELVRADIGGHRIPSLPINIVGDGKVRIAIEIGAERAPQGVGVALQV